MDRKLLQHGAREVRRRPGRRGQPRRGDRRGARHDRGRARALSSSSRATCSARRAAASPPRSSYRHFGLRRRRAPRRALARDLCRDRGAAQCSRRRMPRALSFPRARLLRGHRRRRRRLLRQLPQVHGARAHRVAGGARASRWRAFEREHGVVFVVHRCEIDYLAARAIERCARRHGRSSIDRGARRLVARAGRARATTTVLDARRASRSPASTRATLAARRASPHRSQQRLETLA